MRNLLSTFALSLLLATTAFGEATPVPTETPSGTVTPGAARTLQCANTTGKISIGICGIKGCTTKVTLSGTEKSYLTARTKNTDGSLTYKTLTGKTPKCSITIGALKFGNRLVTAASCAKSLKNAKCQIG